MVKYIYERVGRTIYRRVFGDYSHRQKISVIPPSGEGREEFIIFQYEMIMEHRNKELLPTEYYDEIISLLEEIEEYEKCKDILSIKNLKK
jgi:hypothetical protein